MAQIRPRNIAALPDEALGAFPAVVIEGARQVGKSTLASELAKTRESLLVTLDDDDVRAAAQSDPATFVAQGGDGTLVVDEIQRAPDLLLASQPTSFTPSETRVQSLLRDDPAMPAR